MDILAILALTTVGCMVLRNPIRKVPGVFYALSAALVVFVVALPELPIPRHMWVSLYPFMHKCLLPFSVFVVVMFIGVLPKDSKASLWLRPIRAELSIIGWILTLGHVAIFFNSYFGRLGYVEPFVLAGIIVAFVLFVLLIVLGVTSFPQVKRHMTRESWTRVQRLAYVFFILVYVHLLLILAPSALQGAVQARISVVVYTVLFAAYVVLRIMRASADCKSSRQNLPSG